jgi:hypothetical protein
MLSAIHLKFCPDICEVKDAEWHNLDLFAMEIRLLEKEEGLRRRFVVVTEELGLACMTTALSAIHLKIFCNSFKFLKVKNLTKFTTNWLLLRKVV